MDHIQNGKTSIYRRNTKIKVFLVLKNIDLCGMFFFVFLQTEKH